MSTCLLEHWQYVELNPLRARMVEQAQDWPWSSFRAHTSAAEAPACLDVAALARFNLERDPGSAADHAWVARRYGEWVVQSPPEALWSDALRQQIYQGDEGFVQRMLARASERNQTPLTYPSPSAHGRAASLAEIPDRGAALRAAHIESGLPMSELARELGLSVGRISQLIKKAKDAKKEDL